MLIRYIALACAIITTAAHARPHQPGSREEKILADFAPNPYAAKLEELIKLLRRGKYHLLPEIRLQDVSPPEDEKKHPP